jgi:hypothetical protein
MELYVDVSQFGANLDAKLGADIASAISLSIQTSLAVVRDEWVNRIQNTLHSTRPLYLQGLDFNSVIYPYGSDVFSGAVQLRGTLPNMLENGFGPFDEKIGFSKSSRKHTTKNGGWYLTIPYRHSTPGSYLYGNPMSKQIYAQAKTLQHNESLRVAGGQKTSWTGYVHKANIDDGLTRIVKSYHNPNTGKVTNQSQYYTFRRVSNNSDTLSWMHPGFKGTKMVDQLQDFALKTLERELKKNLANLK